MQDTQALLAEVEAARRAGRIDEAKGLAENALAAAGDAVAKALAQVELGNLLRYAPDTLRAVQLLTTAETALRQCNHPKLARALTLKGMALGDAGDYAAALDLYREAMRRLESPASVRDAAQEAACLGAIGVACTQLQDFAQAEDAYVRAMALYEEAGNRDSNAFVCNNLAILRVRAIQSLAAPTSARAIALGEEMLRFIEQGLAINRASAGSPLATALLLNTQGDGLRALGRTGEALPILEESLAAYRTLGNARGEIDAATDLAAALLELGRTRDALARLLDARRRLAGLDLKDHERRLQELLAEAHERCGEPAAALAHYKAFHQLHRELQDHESQRKLQQIALRAQIDKALRESREDALTGIPNRRRFEELAPQSLPARFALAALDIDHFKKVNDEHSHAVGDAVLRQVGRILGAHCREGDFVARLGGEEFVMLLAGVGAADARESCERLRAAIERHDWSSISARLAVTVSIGMAIADGATPLPELLRAADARLYDAKRGGRNRVCP